MEATGMIRLSPTMVQERSGSYGRKWCTEELSRAACLC